MKNVANYLPAKSGSITTPVIDLTIKIWFFTRVYSYSFSQQPYTSYFFSSICRKMIRIIYTMLAVVIKNLKLCYRNKNLSIEKSIIWFEPYTQKCKTSEYLVFFNSILILIILFKGICSTWEDVGWHTFPTSRSLFVNPQKTGPQITSWGKIGEIRDLSNS